MQAIADICKVSKTTVSLAFNHPEKISKEVRDKIIQTAVDIGYLAKSALSYNKILLVFDGFRNFYFGDYYHDVFYGVVDELRKLKIDMRIYDKFELDYEEFLNSDGIIFCGNVRDEWIAEVQRIKIPFVVCGHPVENQDCNKVIPDFNAGYRSIMEYVIHSGHERIGLIVGGNSEDSLNRLICNEYERALSDNGRQYNEDLIEYANYEDLESVIVAFHKLLSKTPKISALIVADDQFAYQIWNEAERNGISIPEDISLTGFDGIELPWYIKRQSRQLTTVYVDREQIGRRSVSLLIEYLNSKDSDVSNILIETNLVIRDSVKRI